MTGRAKQVGVIRDYRSTPPSMSFSPPVVLLDVRLLEVALSRRIHHSFGKNALYFRQFGPYPSFLSYPLFRCQTPQLLTTQASHWPLNPLFPSSPISSFERRFFLDPLSRFSISPPRRRCPISAIASLSLLCPTPL